MEKGRKVSEEINVDNSSAIKGFPVEQLRTVQPGSSCLLNTITRCLDILFTAETHNFPCSVAPYPGAETGAGGRIRDTHATGRGSKGATTGHCVGNLNIEGSYAPLEDPSFTYLSNLASPLQILIDASNGASDYGNKFGEPLIQGYLRAFGMRLHCGERRDGHWCASCKDCRPSMVSGQNYADLDFNAVQRGATEMAQKLYRVVRAFAEMGEKNPIISIHDQGASGNNIAKGAVIDIWRIVIGDNTMSVLEIWGAEYQEQYAILVKPESRRLLHSICDRERVSMAIIVTISGDGHILKGASSSGLPPPPPAVDLQLEKVLGDMMPHPLGVAAISSVDGMHLAMMPHLGRCFLMWQFPWYPKHWDVEKKGLSHWLRMFQNAREWCS
ncbi:unnamed protein product [Ilex paraguariensis]|uniref:PurM-like C-terminal domain-containing protein n=1 Tax=Ilex paraguariensis TaxID=185542 RepID=A0ABC8QQM5_9AQUA